MCDRAMDDARAVALGKDVEKRIPNINTNMNKMKYADRTRSDLVASQ